MDERRKSYFRHPDYSAEERERSYTLFAEEAAALTADGRNVILDATAYKLAMAPAWGVAPALD